MSTDQIQEIYHRFDDFENVVTARLDSQDAETASIRTSLKKIEGYVDNAIKEDEHNQIIAQEDARRSKEREQQERERWAKIEKWYPTFTVIGILMAGLVGVPVIISFAYWIIAFVVNSFGHILGHPAP